MAYTLLGVLRDLAIAGSFGLITIGAYKTWKPSITPVIPTEIRYGSFSEEKDISGGLVVKLGDSRHAFLKQDDGTFKSIGDLRKEEYSELLKKLEK